jgi:acid phosphatase type 7
VAVLAVAGGLGLLTAAVFGNVFGSGETVTQTGQPEVLLAAGDIAECPTNGDEATAEILGRFPAATIATLGDNVYDHGTEAEFEQCFAPSWGRYKERIRPATGNHDFATENAAGYYAYFGDAGGPFDQYYYSYDLGEWHIVVLNSDCWRVDGCELGDPQIEWLREELAGSGAACTLAYMHRPPFSSGRYGTPKNTKNARPIWQTLYEEGADILLTGHEHSYERFAPMNAEGEADLERGVRLFVVGTGGGNLRKFKFEPLPTTEARDDTTWGVLKLTLHSDRYEWEFIPVAGKTFRDSGSGTCH